VRLRFYKIVEISKQDLLSVFVDASVFEASDCCPFQEFHFSRKLNLIVATYAEISVK
jgi:hypothetical protein